MRRRAVLAALPLGLLSSCAAQNGTSVELARQPVRVIFFQDDSIALGPDAVRVVQDAAAVAARYPSAPVRVLGYIAPDPDHAPTIALSRARAERVASELARLGVARERIQVQGRGTAPFADVPVESRRVEIHVGAA
jgi:outer membrane protein OmpA-like peptidoglycan-associated protein